MIKAEDTMTCDLTSSGFLSNGSRCEEHWPDTVDLASSPSPTAPINEAHIWPPMFSEPAEPWSLLGGSLMCHDLSEVTSELTDCWVSVRHCAGDCGLSPMGQFGSFFKGLSRTLMLAARAWPGFLCAFRVSLISHLHSGSCLRST